MTKTKRPTRCAADLRLELLGMIPHTDGLLNTAAVKLLDEYVAELRSVWETGAAREIEERYAGALRRLAERGRRD